MSNELQYALRDGVWGYNRVSPADIVSPTDIPNCALWLDASQLGLAEGAKVSRWTDLSGNNYHAIQPTAASQPTYKVGIQNGLNVVRFDETIPTFLHWSGAALNLFRNLNGWTLGVVLRRLGGSSDIFTASDGAGGGWYRVRLNMPLGVNFSNDDTLESTPLSVATPNTGTRLLTTVAAVDLIQLPEDVTPYDNYPLVHVRQNGQEVSEAGLGIIRGPTPNTASDEITLGVRYGGSNNPFTGDICELVVYQRFLNERERRQLSEYLSSKWATM